MSADSQQQIDITPYKVRRENVITLQQQKSLEPKPNDDLASSILEKLTEIKSNLYPTHLNIPPHKTGMPQSSVQSTYNTLTSAPISSGLQNIVTGLETLSKKDTYYASMESKESSPDIGLKEQPSQSSNHLSRIQNLYESNLFKSNEVQRGNQENEKLKSQSNNIPETYILSSNYGTSNLKLGPSFTIVTSQPYELSTPSQSVSFSPVKNGLEVLDFSEAPKSSLHMTPTTSMTPYGDEKLLSNNLKELVTPMTPNKNQLNITTESKQERSNSAHKSTQTKIHIKSPADSKITSRSQLLSSLDRALKAGGESDVAAESLQKSQLASEVTKKLEFLQKSRKKSAQKLNKTPSSISNVSIEQGLNKRFSFGHMNSDRSESIDQILEHKQNKDTEDTKDSLNNTKQTPLKNMLKVNNLILENKLKKQNTGTRSDEDDTKNLPISKVQIGKLAKLDSEDYNQQPTNSGSSASTPKNQRSISELPATKKGNEFVQKENTNRVSLNSSPPKKERVVEGSYSEEDHTGSPARKNEANDYSVSPQRGQPVRNSEKPVAPSYASTNQERPERKTTTKNQSFVIKEEFTKKSLRQDSEHNSQTMQNFNSRQPKVERSPVRQNVQNDQGYYGSINSSPQQYFNPQLQAGGSPVRQNNQSAQRYYEALNWSPPAQVINPTNMQMPMNMNMNIPMPNFGADLNNVEFQKYMLMVMNHYETHLNNMKAIIVKQGETLHQAKNKNQSLDQQNTDLSKKIETLEASVKDQSNNVDLTQKELKSKYEIVMDELTTLKRNLLIKQVNPIEEVQAAHRQTNEGREFPNLLYHEVLALRKDLENQRSTITDFKSSSRYIESQIKDLEKMYVDELKSNSKVNPRREQPYDGFDEYKRDYAGMDGFNKMAFEGYGRAYQPGAEENNRMQDMNGQMYGMDNRGRSGFVMGSPNHPDKTQRDLYIRSISPPKNSVEENNLEMLKNKMRAQDSQVKNLLQWNDNSKSQSVNVNLIPANPEPQQKYYQMNSYQNNQPMRRGYSPQQNPTKAMIAPNSDVRSNKSQFVFPSFQKMEDNKVEVKQIDMMLAQLGQHRKMIENELFKMPTVAKTLEQKRKKMALEMELEGVENKIEECKNKLRKYDVLSVK